MTDTSRSKSYDYVVVKVTHIWTLRHGEMRTKLGGKPSLQSAYQSMLTLIQLHNLCLHPLRVQTRQEIKVLVIISEK